MKNTILIPVALFFLVIACKNNNEDKAVDDKKATESKITPAAFEGLNGEWEYEYNPDNEDLPETLFTLNIISTANGEFQAQYCSVAQKGKKIDCSTDKEINVKGNYKADKVVGTFYSFFDSKKTQGEVEIEVLSKDSIRWTIKKTGDFEHYAPTTCILTRVKKNPNEDCKDIEVEMGSGRECILKNTDLEKAYKDIIKNKEVEDSKFYLSEIPKENQTVEVNQNGLISIEYVIKKDKIEISMGYEGGNTEVSLEKVDNNVKRNIYHYAD